MVDLREYLERVADGDIAIDDALREIEGFTRVGDFARIDTDRAGRIGLPEVVLGDGKPPDDLAQIAAGQIDAEGRVIVTRVSDEGRAALERLDVDAVWHERARVMVLAAEGFEPPTPAGTVAVLTGGTSDVPVAEEAAAVAEAFGCEIETAFDVGVAGIHRVLSVLDSLDGADCFVVAAGREGSLPTVVAGLVDAPVIGLPVSTGYGYGGDGEAALKGMLQSCTVLSVVNVDAGFVAGAQAAKIARSV